MQIAFLAFWGFERYNWGNCGILRLKISTKQRKMTKHLANPCKTVTLLHQPCGRDKLSENGGVSFLVYREDLMSSFYSNV